MYRSKKNISIILLVFFYAVLGAPRKTTTTTADDTWDNGNPDLTQDIINVGHEATLTSAVCGQCEFDVYGDASSGGAQDTLFLTGNFEIGSQGVLTIRSGAAVRINGDLITANGATLLVEPGGYIGIYGTWTNNNNSDGVTINGTLYVSGGIYNGNGGDIVGSGTIESDGPIDNDQGGTIGGSTGNDTGTLPIELADFQAHMNESGIRIHWTSATEINNEIYSLERSYDGIEWTSVTELPGAGNSSEPITYEFFDLPPSFGRIYYRLTQTDYDGTSETFPFITVLFENPGNETVKVFPSLVTPEIQQIQISNVWGEVQSQEIVIYDLQGRLTKANVSSIDPTYIAVDVDKTLKGGLYLLKGQVNGVGFSQRIVIRQ